MSDYYDDLTPASLGWIGLLVIIGFWGLQSYYLDRDLDAVQDRAQIAANPRDMLTYLGTLLENLEKHRATTGHTALLMKTPATDLALHFQAVNSVMTRLEQIQALPPDSTAYQTALDDLRGVLREMPRIGDRLFWVRYAWWLGLLALVCLVMISTGE